MRTSTGMTLVPLIAYLLSFLVFKLACNLSYIDITLLSHVFANSSIMGIYGLVLLHGAPALKWPPLYAVGPGKLSEISFG